MPPKGGERRGNQNLCSLGLLSIYRSSPLFNSGPGGVVELDFDKSIRQGVNINPESLWGRANPLYDFLKSREMTSTRS